MKVTKTWRKSSRSSAENACVELSVATARTEIRDSKNQAGATLSIPAGTWVGFLARVKADEMC